MSGGRRGLLLTVATVVIGLSAAATASGAGTRPVTATAEVVQAATCSAPVQRGNVEIRHCTDGEETWSGDITGTGIFSYDSITNLTTDVRVVVNGVETISNACVLDTCGGTLYSRWNEQDLPTGSFHIEQSFRGGTGPFAQAHGSIQIDPVLGNVYTGHVGI
jgi:hypothetical protein